MRIAVFLAVLALGVIACTKENKKKTTEQVMENAQEWKHTTNIYEVNVRQYTQEGTFKAFQKELPRLKEMGVETIWLMPITPISQKNKKGSMGSPYAAADYTSINTEFGNLDDFKDLVKEAHQLGMKVIIDWVANHTGWDHVWIKTHPEYYLKEKDGNFKIASGMDDIIELDYTNSEMRKAMIEAMKFWVKETDIDGFRCDLAAWVEVDFWQQARPEVEKLKPLFWLGEFDELENPDYGKVFDASYSWTWMHKTKEYYEKDLPLQDLRDLLLKYSNIGDSSMRAWFTTNHDENSWNGTEYEKYGFITKPLAVFSVTWNGVPLMYSGQELPNMKRIEFFEKDVIQWTGDNQLSDFYKKLLNLKKTNPALRGGDKSVKTHMIKTSADDKILSYLRKKDNKEVLVLLNMSKTNVEFTIEDNQVSGNYSNIFGGNMSFPKKEKIIFKPGDYLVLTK